MLGDMKRVFDYKSLCRGIEGEKKELNVIYEMRCLRSMC